MGLHQNLNILMIGAKDGKGGFFPKGIEGRINTPQGFDQLAEGLEDWTGKAEATQVRVPLPVTSVKAHSLLGRCGHHKDLSAACR